MSINFQNFVIILLSQTVVRTLSRQPFFFIIRYSFPTYLTFLSNRKTPETQGFWGILRLDTTLSCDNKSIFRLYYSMIVATRPDPTVRPPSRYRSCILRRFFRIFLSFYYHFQPEIRSVFLILNYFVIILLSQLLW